MDSIYRKHLEGTGITENQLSVMMTLYKKGKIEQKEIGKFLILERSSLSRNLVRLIDQHLVIKEGVLNRPLIFLSQKGRRKVKSIVPLWEKAMVEINNLVGNKALSGLKDFENGFKQT